MNQFFFLVGDYLKGKSVYPSIRRVLNLLFSISITSFLFESFYFKYNWLDFTDYKNLLNFFIKGHFFVPFSLFIIIHACIDIFAEGVFTLSTLRNSSALLKKIINYEFKKEDYRNLLSTMNDNPVVEMPVEWNKSFIVKLFSHIKSSVPADAWQKFEEACEKQKQLVKKNFNLAFKALVVITIYFVTLSYFGWLLYLLVLIMLTVVMAGLWFSYLLLDVLPAGMRKFHYAVESFLENVNTTHNNEEGTQSVEDTH